MGDTKKRGSGNVEHLKDKVFEIVKAEVGRFLEDYVACKATLAERLATLRQTYSPEVIDALVPNNGMDLRPAAETASRCARRLVVQTKAMIPAKAKQVQGPVKFSTLRQYVFKIVQALTAGSGSTFTVHDIENRLSHDGINFKSGYVGAILAKHIAGIKIVRKTKGGGRPLNVYARDKSSLHISTSVIKRT